MGTPPPDAKYPDTIAITFDETKTKVTAVYNDHSVYVWDVFDIRRVKLVFYFSFILLLSCNIININISGWEILFIPLPLSLYLGS